MRALNDVFECWTSVPEMAVDVGESHWVVAKWKQRKSIPSSAWPALIEALKRKGKDIGAAELLAMHTRIKGSPSFQKDNGGKAA